VLACGKVRRLPCVRQECLHGIFARIAKGAMDDIHGVRCPFIMVASCSPPIQSTPNLALHASPA